MKHKKEGRGACGCSLSEQQKFGTWPHGTVARKLKCHVWAVHSKVPQLEPKLRAALCSAEAGTGISIKFSGGDLNWENEAYSLYRVMRYRVCMCVWLATPRKKGSVRLGHVLYSSPHSPDPSFIFPLFPLAILSTVLLFHGHLLTYLFFPRQTTYHDSPLIVAIVLSLRTKRMRQPEWRIL